MVPKSILSLAINVVALLPTTALQGKRGLRLLSTVRPAIVVDGKGSMSTSMKDLSAQIKEMRGSLVEDERTAMMIDALRGKNMNDDDAQRAGIKMRLVESERRADASSDSLPTLYDPVKLQKYFSARPGVVATRMWQVSSSTASFFAGVLSDYLRGKLADTEVRRAAELRNTIVSLGPFFIKLGQALSIRPDLLSPRAMVELQQLCDKVPCFDSALAMRTIEQEFGRPVAEIFSTISPEPVAAASLGQVYKATLASTGEAVAVKVQRPGVLETVSLDLHLVRQAGRLLRRFPALTKRFDIVAILDEFAGNFYAELDYELECANGIRIAKDMARIPQVLIPKNYPEYTTRRVHTAQWIEGEKLSQSKAGDVSSLVNLGVITYLTQLLDTGFFHADPHPGNMLRSPDGRLVILDFGLMTQITENQKYGMIEAIAHLIHRDYAEIGQDFRNLDFIPEGVDTAPIIPALSRVFDAALAGGGAKSINFQELAADLAEITFKFPFRIPPYFALIIRAISVLEGIALVGDPNFAIVDEAYPFIARKLMTDRSPRLRAAFRYMVYGKSATLDMDRLVDMLQALEAFLAVRDNNGRGGTGDLAGRRDESREAMTPADYGTPASGDALRESLLFFFSDDGEYLREMVLDEVSAGLDALSRNALFALSARVGIRATSMPRLLQALTPELTPEDGRVVESTTKLLQFLAGDEMQAVDSDSRVSMLPLTGAATSLRRARQLALLAPVLSEFAPNVREFGVRVTERLVRKASGRALNAIFQ